MAVAPFIASRDATETAQLRPRGSASAQSLLGSAPPWSHTHMTQTKVCLHPRCEWHRVCTQRPRVGRRTRSRIDRLGIVCVRRRDGCVVDWRMCPCRHTWLRDGIRFASGNLRATCALKCVQWEHRLRRGPGSAATRAKLIKLLLQSLLRVSTGVSEHACVQMLLDDERCLQHGQHASVAPYLLRARRPPPRPTSPTGPRAPRRARRLARAAPGPGRAARAPPTARARAARAVRPARRRARARRS